MFQCLGVVFQWLSTQFKWLSALLQCSKNVQWYSVDCDFMA